MKLLKSQYALQLVFLGLGNLACTNLSWSEPKTYITPPSASTVTVDGFGISDVVDILPPGVTTITVSHAITNDGAMDSPGGYSVTDTVNRWVFQSSPSGTGYVPGPPATHEVTSMCASPGPPVAAGGTVSYTCSGVVVPPPADCGLYAETLTVDSTNLIAESSESDNADTNHFFFIPSSQQFNITVTPILGTLFHNAGDTITTDFVVTAAGAPGWIYAGFSFVAQEGSTAYTVPAPGGPPAGPAPQTIRMHIVPRAHNLSTGGGTVTGKITVISMDGCVLKQQTATVFVEH